MNAKEYLLQIQKLDILIENKLLEIIHWKAIATRTTAHLDGDRVQSSGSKQKMADAVDEYVDGETELGEEIKTLSAARKDIIRTIELLPPKEYDLLHKIYVQGMEMYEAATEMDKSYRWATSIHGRALANVQKLLNERSENEKQHENQIG